MRAETSATSAVVTLSVAVAVAGHVLVSGGSVPLAVVPQLLALAGACWLLGEFLSEELAIVALATVQLVVHFTLNSSHQAHGHDMSMPMATEPMHMTVGGTLAMSVAHLVALLAGVGLIGHAHSWATRVRRILTRLIPELPAVLIVVPAIRRVLTEVPEPQLTQRWLNSNGSRRGPPHGPVSLALS